MIGEKNTTIIINKPMTTDEEIKIVRGILNGNSRSLRVYYTYFKPKILAYIENKISSKEDAEEILQDVFLSSLDSLRNFTFQASLTTYLFKIVKNKIVDFYRKKKIKRLLFSQIPKLEIFLSKYLTVEENLDKQYKKEVIINALNSLKPKYKKIITLKYIEGKSVIEITHILKKSFQSTQSLLFRARKAFARALNM